MASSRVEFLFLNPDPSLEIYKTLGPLLIPNDGSGLKTSIEQFMGYFVAVKENIEGL